MPNSSHSGPVLRRPDQLDDGRPAWARSLYLARVERGWTLADLQAATGIHDSMLSRFEHGIMRPTARYQRLLDEALS